MRKSPVLFVLAVMCAVAATAANITPSKATSGTPRPTEQATLYSQMANIVGGAAAQDFEAAYDQYDCYVADDFNVTWAGGWGIQQIHTPGSYSVAGPAAGIQVEILANSGGLPGASVCSGLATIVTDTAGDIVSALPAQCDLATGTYWLSVAARLDYNPGGQWYVGAEGATTGSIARWYNPGDGFGNGCTTWGSCDVTAINAAYLDMSFEILGVEVPVELQSFSAE